MRGKKIKLEHSTAVVVVWVDADDFATATDTATDGEDEDEDEDEKRDTQITSMKSRVASHTRSTPPLGNAKE